MTFLQIVTAVYDDLNYQAAPAADVVARLKRYVNEGYTHLLRQPRLTDLRNGTIAVASVAAQPIYGLPQAFDRITAIVDTTNSLRLTAQTQDWYRTADPGEQASGTPYAWVPQGWVPVFFQPASTGVWVASSSASDITPLTARLNGIRANGDPVGVVTTTLTGTTRVAMGTLTDYVAVHTPFSLSAAAVGTVSFYNAASAGSEIARIPIGAVTAQYMGIRLWPTPGAALTYKVDGQLAIEDMVSDTDTPILPPPYHEMLGVYARLRFAKKMGDWGRFQAEQGEWERWSNQLLSFVEYPADYHPVRGGRSLDALRWNNLGGAYPPDGYGS